jgi:hypothetical protein
MQEWTASVLTAAKIAGNRSPQSSPRREMRRTFGAPPGGEEVDVGRHGFAENLGGAPGRDRIGLISGPAPAPVHTRSLGPRVECPALPEGRSLVPVEADRLQGILYLDSASIFGRLRGRTPRHPRAFPKTFQF